MESLRVRWAPSAAMALPSSAAAATRLPILVRERATVSTAARALLRALLEVSDRLCSRLAAPSALSCRVELPRTE